jgi:hypothetical protein
MNGMDNVTSPRMFQSVRIGTKGSWIMMKMERLLQHQDPLRDLLLPLLLLPLQGVDAGRARRDRLMWKLKENERDYIFCNKLYIDTKESI